MQRMIHQEDFMHQILECETDVALDDAPMTRPLPPVVLASRSPRRRELLTSHGIRHSVVNVAIDDGELCSLGREPRSWVMSLAYLKAAAGRCDALFVHEESAVLLGADTICVQGGRIIGQPRDEDHARSMILELSNGVHDVLTGVALLDPLTGRRDLFFSAARVRVGHLLPVEVDSYVASGLWQGKAGGYNLGERLDAGWPIDFEGDPTGVMGLPMTLLVPRLSRFAAAT